MSRRGACLAAMMGVALLLAVVTAGQAAAPASGVAAPPPLPSTRLEFGLSNLDSSWMTGSGVPWRYRYQYLAGGVNTPNNWLTWQDPAKPAGQFALDYMTNSTTAPANYIPVFTWYQLLQSTPSIGGSELDRDYSNLNNASTMSSYYASFKVLMQKAGQYGGQVVVHIEPDFWGYMQQKAAGGSATSVPAMVKSSGFAEAAAFPDSVAGFASELKYLRDTYAPNALLAMHASLWSSSIDIGSDTRSTIDSAAEADKTAAFLASAGAGTWDAVFNDVDDHDAAWWELASCGTPPCVNQYYTHWWDTTNTKFPNFTRYLAWVAELHAKTGLPQIVWQVPVGNQYFLTMNNTCGHYQDNVAQYFIEHASDLFNAGLVAVLFGKGNSCQTTYDDFANDGVTNNSGAPTTDTLGACNACNTHTSTWPDDDGGFLRIFVGNYYAGRLPCGGVSVSAVPPSPQATGTAVTLNLSASACANPQFEVWVRSPNAACCQLAQAYGSSATYPWSTAGLPGGTYTFAVWARDANSSGLYANSLGRYDAYLVLTYTLSSPTCTAVSAATSGANPVTVSATASGCPSPRYQFELLAPGSQTWQVVQAYSPGASFSWSTAGAAPGTYKFIVKARDAASSGTYSNYAGSWDSYVLLSYSLGSASPCSSVAASASGTNPVIVSASAFGCPNPRYQFELLAPGSQAWQVVQPYSATATWSWSTTGAAKGTYNVIVKARDQSSLGTTGAGNPNGAWDAYTTILYTIT
jgi:hypothetical protein